MSVRKKELLMLAEACAADPAFGNYRRPDGTTQPYAASVYEGILKTLQTLARTKPDATAAEAAGWLRALPRSQLARGSGGLPVQYRQVLRLAFGLSDNGPAGFRKELASASVSDLIYFAGWLARLTADGCKQLYERNNLAGDDANGNAPARRQSDRLASGPARQPGQPAGQSDLGGLDSKNRDKLTSLLRTMQEGKA